MWEHRYWAWLIARLCVALLLVGGLWWYLMTPDSYETEFKQSREALKTVKTWKYEMLRGENTDRYQEGSAEVDCAAGYHNTSHLYVELPNSAPLDIKDETMRVGKVTYSKTPSGWKQGDHATVMGDPSIACREIAQGEQGGPFPDYAALLDHYIVTKKDKKEISGVRCRNWLAQLPAHPGVSGKEEMTICIGVRDHLPYEISGSNVNHFIFRDYNLPVTLEKPVLAEDNFSTQDGS